MFKSILGMAITIFVLYILLAALLFKGLDRFAERVKKDGLKGIVHEVWNGEIPKLP